MPSHTVSERKKKKVRDVPAARRPLDRGKPAKPVTTEQILKAKRKFIPKKKRRKK